MLSFDDILAETIDEVVKNVFEKDIAKIVLKYLKKNSSKKLNKRVRILADALPKILGESSVIIEDLILETLYSKCGLELKWKRNYRFADYVLDLMDRHNSNRIACPSVSPK